jgi:hypothetical protein
MYTAWSQAETAQSSQRFSLRVRGSAESYRATALQALQNINKEVVVDFRAFDEDIRSAVIQERLGSSEGWRCSSPPSGSTA